MTPRPLPTCPTQTVSETLPEYAARVLRYALDTRCTVTLTDEQINLADHAACRALASLPGEELETADATIARRLSETRHELTATLRRRAQLDREAAQEAGETAQAPQGGRNPGRPAPMQPPPPTRPPQGAYTDPYPTRPTPARVGDGIAF